MIDRRTFLSTAAAAGLSSTLAGCAERPKVITHSMMISGWTALLDPGNDPRLDDFTEVGAGNWRFVDGMLEGKDGKMGYLVTRSSYSDFDLHVDFWADEPANSGIFLRCLDRFKVSADNAYEVNIFDKRPDPTYGTGAIVGFAKVAQPGPMAANRWNNFQISARGDRLVVVLNGAQTVDVRDSRFRAGPIALQSAGGTIRFRRVMIKLA